MKTSVLLICFLLAKGVFSDVVKSVLEGDSVTLHTDLTDLLKYERILWTFGPGRTRIAQINNVVNKISVYNDVLDGKFRDRLQLDDRSGSLTVTNTTTEDSGLYELQTVGGKEVPPNTFSIIVSAPLPVPVITRNSSQCPSPSSSSSSYCSLVCSVVNVGHVTLSWYKGNSLLSSISVSDLSISLSLPLEVEYQDKNSYSCVINNPISNQTHHLDISQLCHTCSASDSSTLYIVLGCLSALAVVAVLCGIFYYYHHRRSKQAGHQSQHDGEENIRLTDVTGNAGDANRLNIAGAETPDQERHSQNNTFVEKDEIKSVSAMVGETVTLHTDVTEIQEDELIRWKFADSKVCKLAEFFVIAKWDKTNNEEYLHDDNKFKDRLHLDHDTGSLVITNITPKHYGHYKLHITSEGQKISKTFNLIAHDPKKRQGTILRRETCP
uniref:Ig-like domain-containing protein n=1 Tax=Cyprinus carpio TaxID=7962 RepID=A0A8C2JBH7_CYPCA